MPACDGYEQKSEPEKIQFLYSINDKFNPVFFTFAGLKVVTVLTGLAIVFVWKK